MKKSKELVCVIAALSGIAANIGGLVADRLSSYGNLYFNELSASSAIFIWLSLLSILLWIVFIILFIIDALKHKSAK